MTDHPRSQAGDRLRGIADDFLALHRDPERSNPVAGLESVSLLSSRYACAQGIANAALSLLLTLSTHPLAYRSADGHYAIEYLGRAVQLGADATARLATAVSLATEYHRIDGLPDPATGRTRPQRPVRRPELKEQLDHAATLLGTGYVHATDAAQFLDAAEHRAHREATGPRTRVEATPGPAVEPTAAAPASALGLSRAQETALHAVSRGYARLHESADGKPRIETGPTPRISAATLASLQTKGLVEPESGLSVHYTGRRLLLTAEGSRALASIGPAPSPSPSRTAPPPVATTAVARTARRGAPAATR